jgi:hypothetical protein
MCSVCLFFRLPCNGKNILVDIQVMETTTFLIILSTLEASFDGLLCHFLAHKLTLWSYAYHFLTTGGGPFQNLKTTHSEKTTQSLLPPPPGDQKPSHFFPAKKKSKTKINPFLLDFVAKVEYFKYTQSAPILVTHP